jgi:hypothetical protein
MDTPKGAEPPPKSTDLDGWRRAIADGRLPTFRLEELIAAIQDLGPSTDRNVRNALAKHLSDAIVRMLRRAVGLNRPNQGKDIIYRVHADLFEALLDPNSKDGKGLREAFYPRAMFRVKDAIALENKHSRIPVQQPVKRAKGAKSASLPLMERTHVMPPPEPADRTPADDRGDGEEAVLRNANRDLTLLDGVRDTDQQIDVDRFLEENIADDRKRLAFRLYMDGVPFKSKRTNSIAKTLGVSDKTAEHWIAEVQEILRRKLGDRT